jgi:hypothetical protein
MVLVFSRLAVLTTACVFLRRATGGDPRVTV